MNKNTKYIIKNLIYVLLIVVFGISTVFSFLYFVNNKQTIKVGYKDTGKVDYNVYLINNDFFEESYLPSGITYVSSLIDYIDVNFSYNMIYSQTLKGNYTYEIDAILKADKQGDNTSNYWSKEYTLDSGTDTYNGKVFNFNKNIKINYKDYVTILNKFKRTAGLSVDGTLEIVLKVNSTGNYDTYKTPVSTTSKVLLEIPLTEASVNITPTTSDKTTENEVVLDTVHHYTIKHYLSLITSVFSLILFAIFIILLIESILSKNKYKSKFEIELEKILSTYNSIIVNVDNVKDLRDYNIIPVNSFDELLDAHSEVRMPINYLKNGEKEEAVFILLNDNVAWIYRLK